MKTITLETKSSEPTTFPITVLPAEFTLPDTSTAAPVSEPLSFADLMLHPDKLEAALKTARQENETFEASRMFSSHTSNNALI
jgi:hypothetical protein